MQEGLDAFKSGQVAMQMNFFAFFPGLYKDPNVGADKIGFFVNPKQKLHYQLGGQGSRSSPIRSIGTTRSPTSVVRATRGSEKVVGAWRLSCHKGGAQ